MFDTTFKIAILEIDFKEDNIFLQSKVYALPQNSDCH